MEVRHKGGLCNKAGSLSIKPSWRTNNMTDKSIGGALWAVTEMCQYEYKTRHQETHAAEHRPEVTEACNDIAKRGHSEQDPTNQDKIAVFQLCILAQKI